GGEAHVGLGADAYERHATLVVELEVDALTLTQEPEQRTVERSGREHELGAIGVAHDDALTGLGGVDADDALHRYGVRPLPALRQDVHTWMRRGAPLTIARTRCTFGFHRRFVRRCEWLKRMPNCGFLPHTSQTDAIVKTSYKEPVGTQKASSEADTIPAVG